MKKICVVTGTRAEYGLFFPILKKIQAFEKLQLQLVVTTMHLSEEFGNTSTLIEADGFVIDEYVDNLLPENDNISICKSTGLALASLAEVYNKLKPDVVLLLGDRFETHAAATAALLMSIPIAHIHGGEISQGAIDDSLRHSITKMSQLHFTATEEYRQRIIQMGEQPENVIVSGAPGIDNIYSMQFMSKIELEQNLQWQFAKKNILFTYHPVTVDTNIDDNLIAINKILTQLTQLDSNFNILFTYANADQGGKAINQAIEAFVATNNKRYKVVKSLGQLRYLSAMKVVDLLVGNSSSAIIEAASFTKPVVNIGRRQEGRLQSGNVVDCEVDNIVWAINKALSHSFVDNCHRVTNIYSGGNAADIIATNLQNRKLITEKRFCDFVR